MSNQEAIRSWACAGEASKLQAPFNSMLKRVSLGGRDFHTGVFRNKVNLGMNGYLVRRSLLGDAEVAEEAATDRRVTENHYPSDDNPYDSLYPVDDRADSVSVPQHGAKLNFGKMASAGRHATSTQSMGP